MTFLQQGGANLFKFVRESFVVLEVPSSVGSQKLQGGGGGERMILIVVEAVPLAQRMIACALPPVGKAALAL